MEINAGKLAISLDLQKPEGKRGREIAGGGAYLAFGPSGLLAAGNGGPR